VMRGPVVAISENKSQLISLMSNSRLSHCEYIDENVFHPVLANFDASGAGGEQQVRRAIQFELWMRRSSSRHMQTNFSS
jgi:hypothetical protein